MSVHQDGLITAYIYDNALLGDNGDQFLAALVEVIIGTENECFARFSEGYDINDFCMSFTKPT